MKLSAKTIANRANSMKSCGPVTPEGKWRSSQNSRTHGLTSKILPPSLEPGAQPPLDDKGNPINEFQELLDLYIADLDPGSQVEADLVRALASHQWHLRRADAWIQNATADLTQDSLHIAKIFENYTRQQARVQRIYNQTLNQYHETKNERLEAQQARLDNATTIFKLLQEEEHPSFEEWDPTEVGFDFTRDEVMLNLFFREVEKLASTHPNYRESTLHYNDHPLVDLPTNDDTPEESEDSPEK